MKRTLAVLMLALPLTVAGLAKSASAAEYNFNDGQNAPRSSTVVADRNQPGQFDQNRRPDDRRDARRPEFRRVWVQGHYQPGFLGIGRRWVPGHWETVRV